MTARVSLLIVACLLNLGCLAAADAQTRAKRPGVFHRGRFIGYAPAHLKATSLRPSTLNAEPSLETVKQAEFISETAEQPEVFSEDIAVPSVDDPFENSEVLEPIFDEAMDGHPVEWLAPTTWETSCLWGRAEFLLWWTRGMDVPPLATTSPAGTPMNQAGVLGQPGTTILFGGARLNNDVRPGGRFTLGKWLDGYQCQGLEATYLFLGSKASSFAASNNDFPILARPFFNVQNNAEDARRIAFPGEVSGTLDIQAESDFQAFEAQYRVAAMNVPGQRVDFLLGYRFGELEDRIGIREVTEALAGPIAGTTFDLVDDFDMRNTFHGGQLGIVFACQRDGCWTWEAMAKVALGNTKSRASVFGQTTTTTAGGGATTTQAGLLAQSTNVGTFEQSSFSTVTELDITAHRKLDCGISLSIGYSILYWSEVARAGDQIDLGINTSQIPPGMLTGSPRPAFPFDQTDFWALGLRLGVDYTY